MPSFAKALAIAAAIGVGAVVVFAGALNVFIGTRLFRHLISYDPGSLLLDYDRAYSLWPGRIHVEGLVIRGRDRNVEWSLELDRCDFREHFVGLFRHEFHAGPVTCDGLSLRLRQRKPAWTASEVAATPPVPGFPDPALSEPGPPPPPLTDANYNLWSVRLDDVVAHHVREIWVDTMRVAGDADVRGRWYFRPIRRLEVGPATIDAHPLDVGDGTAAQLVSEVRGLLHVTVDGVDLRDAPLAAIVDQTSIAGDITAKAHTRNILRAFSPGTRFEASDAPVTASVRVDHGVARPGSEVTAGPFHAQADSGKLSIKSTLHAHAVVDAADRVRADITARDLLATLGARSMRGNMNLAIHAHREGAWTNVSGSGLSFIGYVGAAQTSAPGATAPDWWANAELSHALYDTTGGLHLRADVAVQAKDASPLVEAIASDTPLPLWLLDAASTRRFETRGQILASPAALEARDVDAHAQGVDARFAYLRRSPQTDWALYLDLGALSAGIASHDGKAAVMLLDARSWFDARAATIRASGVHE